MHRSLVFLLCAALTAAVMTPVAARGAKADVATLTRIASRIDARTGVITIEASDPVPYVATQPDSRSFILELRDTSAIGFTDAFKADPRNPIASVQVEGAHAEDGVDVVRIRMTLSQAVRPRVRSSRNLIYVEADRNESAGAAEAISLTGPSSVIRDLNVAHRGAATAVSLLATGPLDPLSVAMTKNNAKQLVLSFANTTSALATSTSVKQGPVDRVSVRLDPKAPLVTQVVMDLSRTAPYRVESSPDNQSLTVVFDEQAADPITALTLAGGAAARPTAAAVQAPVGPAAPLPAAPASPAVVQGPPALPPPSTSPLAPGQPSRYTGFPVTLDFTGADLRQVLRTFAEISGLNMVIDPTIQGTVDVSLKDVPWDQALDIILRANKLGYSLEGTIVRVAPISVLKAEEDERKAYLDSQTSALPLETKTYALSYAKATEISTLLKTSQVLSPRGNATVHDATNTLIVSDLPGRMDDIGALIAKLDVAQPQVEIEARIVQTTRDFARDLGVQWGFGGQSSTALGNTTPLAFPNNGTIGGRAGGANDLVNLGVGGATSAIGLALGSVNGAVNLDIALSALEKQGHGRILSTPRVFAQNNQAAEITQGTQIPIQTVANNTVTVSFKDAALTLKVTPQITASDTVIMAISVENASPDFSRQVNNIPPIDTQRAVTQVLVNNGETTVIGGVYVSRQQTAQDRTPVLYRLPLLGWLFRHDHTDDASTELLIFITPRIQRL
jgi:type IV pilus assembly protein PilQ